MKSEFLEYPNYKEKYPNRTMSDWLLYSKRHAYNELSKMYSEHQSELSLIERDEIEDKLKELKSELNDN